MLVGKKPTGTLVLDGLRPGRNLYLLGTGTGLAPFLSLVRDPEVYERFDKVIVTHTVREVADLNYREFFEHDLPNDPDLGEMVAPKLIYYPTVTREPFEHPGPDHRPDRVGQALRRHRPAAARPDARPR